MATKITEASLTCAICLRRFRKPRILPCLHSYCEDCLIEYTRPTGTEVLLCPLCQEEVKIPDGDVTKFKLDFRLKSMVEDANRYEKEAGISSQWQVCNCCKDEGDAIATCMKCGQVLCKFGVKAHENIGGLQSHNITPLADEDSDQVEMLMSQMQTLGAEADATMGADAKPDGQKWPPEKRAILVSNIPNLKCTNATERMRDRLAIHFLRKRNGGGDIDGILYPLEGCPQRAIVVFSDKKISDRVLQIDQVLEDFKAKVVVEPFPQVFNNVEAEVDAFYWNLVPRLTTSRLIDEFSKIFGKKNLQTTGHVLRRVVCTMSQLDQVHSGIVRATGLRASGSSESVIESGILIQNIPYLTDETEQLRQELSKHLQLGGVCKLDKLMCPIQGNAKEAIALFASPKDRENYISSSDRCFYGETLHVVRLPPIFTNLTAHLDDFFTKVLQQHGMTKYRAKLQSSCGQYQKQKLVVSERALSGSPEQLEKATASILQMTGLSEAKLIPDQPTDADNVYRGNKRAPGRIDFRSDQDHGNNLFKADESLYVNSQRSHRGPFSVVTLLYTYLEQKQKKKMDKIVTKYGVKIECPSDQTGGQGEVYIIGDGKRSAKQLDEAAEEFISLYQRCYQDVIIKPIACEGVGSQAIDKATSYIWTKYSSVLVETSIEDEITFIGTEGEVAEAIRMFQRNTGLQPKLQKLKHPTGAFTPPMPMSPPNADQDQERFTNNRKLTFAGASSLKEDSSSSSENKLRTDEGVEVIAVKDDITRQPVDVIVNPSNDNDEEMDISSDVRQRPSALFWKEAIPRENTSSELNTSSDTGQRTSAKFWTEKLPSGNTSRVSRVVRSNRRTDTDLDLRRHRECSSDNSGMETPISYTMGKLRVIVKQQHVLETMKEVESIILPTDKMLNNMGEVARTVITAAGIDKKALLQEKTSGFGLRDGEIVYMNGKDLGSVTIVFLAISEKKRHLSNRDFVDVLTYQVCNSLKYADTLSNLSKVALSLLPPDICKTEVSSEVFVKAIRRFSDSGPKNIRQIHVVSEDAQSNMSLQCTFGEEFKDDFAGSRGYYAMSGGNRASGKPTDVDLDNEGTGNEWVKNRGSNSMATHDKEDPKKDEAKKEDSDEEDTWCPGCLQYFGDVIPPVNLEKCKHKCCQECLDVYMKMKRKPMCPVCGVVYGAMKGNQPPGHMSVSESSYGSLPGYAGCGIITINYSFRGGTQGPDHPEPGNYYTGTSRTAYLPNNSEGKKVLALLKRAFDAKLIFTIGTSVTSGVRNIVTWNDIHHKTSISGGPQSLGYPDPTYLSRVTEELAAKGIK